MCVTTRSLLLLDHFGGGTVECDLYGGQRIVALVGHGLEGAGDSAVGLGVAEGSEAPGNCLPDLGHADIALGAGVGEQGVGVVSRVSNRARLSAFIALDSRSVSKRALSASNSERSDAVLTVAMGYPDSTAMIAPPPRCVSMYTECGGISA